MAQPPGRFTNQVQVLQDQLENLLSKDWGPTRAVAPFEAQSDLSQLETLKWSLPDLDPERSQILFERIAPYFESGFCFHDTQESSRKDWMRWRLTSAFHRGRAVPLLPEDSLKELDLPFMTLTEIRRLDGEELLEKLKLVGLFQTDGQSTLALRPSDRRLWIVYSHLPDVFLKNHVSAIHEECLKILADFPDEVK